MTDGFFGQTGLPSHTSEENALRSAISQHVDENVRTAFPVVVKAVHDGGVGMPPTVDVQPSVSQIDGFGNKTDHGVIYGLPVMRIQGGKGAIIADPKEGDYGFVLASDRDISALKANAGKPSTPGSFRRYNMADGVYIGAILAVTPESYVQFTDDGVVVHGTGGNSITMDGNGLAIADKNGNHITMSSSGINLNGVIIDSSGNISTPGSMTAGAGGADSVTVQHHTHTGNGVPPTPGT